MSRPPHSTCIPSFRCIDCAALEEDLMCQRAMVARREEEMEADRAMRQGEEKKEELEGRRFEELNAALKKVSEGSE